MENKGPKTMFWTVLITVNLLALVFPIGFLLQADNDPLRLLGISATYAAAFLLMIADTVIICCLYFMYT